jgi:hypothetical protein
MRTIIKLCICVLMIFSFTACFPVLMSGRGEGQGRYYYNNHQYNNGREYRQARRGASVQVRIEGNRDNNRGERR